MKIIHIVSGVMLFSITACGQQKKKPKDIQKNTQNNQKQNKMDLSKITNKQVRKAVEAQINGDRETFFALFTEDAKMTDDGNSLDLKPFFENAFNHKEKFLSIDKVENDGKNIHGHFDAGQWGVFNVFFKFHQNAEGKFDRLDIGADK
jgi:hypothetical protein